MDGRSSSAALAAIATSGSATDLITGTVPDGRLAGVYTGITRLAQNTADGADNLALSLSGGGGAESSSRGAHVLIYGNEHASYPGRIRIISGSTGYVHVESATQFDANITMDSASIVYQGGSMSIMAGTADGADTLSASLNGGGAAATTRGALIYAYGNEHGSFPGDARIIAGDTGDIRIFGDVVCETSTVIKADTADTADTSSLQLCGGGSGANTRGGYIVLYGNEHGTDPGEVKITPGSTGFIGLAGNTTVTGLVDINVSTTGAILTLTCTNTTAASGADINLYRDSASPAVSDFLSSIRFYGNDSAATQTQYCLIDALTTNVTDTTEAAKVRIHTMQAGASAVRLQIGAGVYHGNATGGDQGDGTLNMDAVYDDGVLLTCFPMQRPFIEQGQIDLDFWDSKAPEKHGRRHHKIAHMFADMVEDGYDPRDWRNHLSRVEGRGALPGMPEIGEWQQAKYPVGEMISRLWLALECQQLAFRSLALEHEELRRKVA